MDYKASAQGVLEAIGGRDNIVSAAHCATRLRLVIADNGKIDKEKLENVDGVKGVFEASGQLQIIFGTGTVNKVYDEFIALAGIEGGSKEDVKKAAASRQNIFLRLIKTLGDVFVPILPAIVASGLLMGILEGLTNAIPGMKDSNWYTFFHLMSSAALTFLPILIAVSSARAFGGNLFLGAVVGMIMIHPDLVNAWSGEAVNEAPVLFSIGAYSVRLVGYQGHVIPVIISVWVMCFIEKKLHKVIPEILDLFVVPLASVLAAGAVALLVVGPIFGQLETWVLDGASWLISVPFGIGGFLVGAAYAPTVVAGVHHMYNIIEQGFLSNGGANIWMPIATAANVAQGAAALAVALKSKSKKVKAMAVPAALSAYLGITEPAIFGVNVRYRKPFIAGMIGGAIGGLYAALMHVGASAYGVTGVFGILITVPNSELGLGVWNIINYIITILIASAAAFAVSFFWYKDEAPCEKDKVYSPLRGKAMPLSEVKDSTFASGVLGQGFAILPEVGKVDAPFNGKITTLFETKHAIGLTNEAGIEVLIHVGLNTVALEGKHFTALVKEGDSVQRGQTLLTFDLKAIAAEGYDVTTPVVVTNADDYAAVDCICSGKVGFGDEALAVREKEQAAAEATA